MNRRPALGFLAASELMGALGLQIAFFVVPLAAIHVLDADPIQIGLLNLTDSAAALLTGFAFGALVDRIGGPASITVAHIVRIAACLLLAVTLAMGPSLGALFIAMFVLGSASLLNEAGTSMAIAQTAGRSERQLNRANSLLRTSEIASSIGGPGLAAFILIASTSAAGVLFGAVAFAVAAACSASVWMTSRAIRKPVSQGSQSSTPELADRAERTSQWSGVLFIARDSFLRPFTASSLHFNFFSACFQAVFIIYCVRNLGFSTASIAIVGVSAGVGGIAGAMFPSLRIAERHAGVIYRTCLTVPAVSLGLMLLAMHPLFQASSVVMVAVAEAVFAFAMVVCVILSNTAVQLTAPPALLGRVSAAERVIAIGGEVPGALVGGLVGTYASVHTVLWLSMIGIAFSSIWMVRIGAWPRGRASANEESSDRVAI